LFNLKKNLRIQRKIWIKKKNNQINELITERKTLKEQLSNTGKERDELVAKNDQLTKQYDEKLTTLEKVEKSLNNKKRKITTFTITIGDLKSQIEEKN